MSTYIRTFVRSLKALFGWMQRARIDGASVSVSAIVPADVANTAKLPETEMGAVSLSRTRRIAVLAETPWWGRPVAIGCADSVQCDNLFAGYRLNRDERIVLADHGAPLRHVPS